MSDTQKSISTILFDADLVKSRFEDSLIQTGIDFDDLSWDPYDNSLELYGVPPDLRLSEAGQRVVYDAGFSQVYVNHSDKWETHYRYFIGDFVPVKGWRVSYPHKRGPGEKGIWVEEVVKTWPKEWFETGHVIVKPRL